MKLRSHVLYFIIEIWMSRMVILISYVLLLWQLGYSNGLTCYNCKGISHPRFCDSVKTCSPDQQCSLAQFDQSGVITYDLGCETLSSCKSRRVKSLDYETCNECCSTDLCNNYGCGESKPNITGTICYSCKGLLSSENCNSVEFCSQNDLCYIDKSDRFGETFTTSGCQTQHACNVHYGSSIIFGRRRQLEEEPTCRRCCDNNLCNDECKIDNIPITTLPTTTTTTIATTTTTQSALSGRNFYLMFLKNISGNNKLVVYVVTDKSGRCTMYDPYQNLNTTQYVSKNTTFILDRQNTLTNIGVDKKLAYLECEMDVTVYGMNYDQRNSDGYFALPAFSLGKQYVIPTFWNGDGHFGIGAAYDHTNISIVLKMVISGVITYNGRQYRSGDHLYLSLSQYQTFYFEGHGDFSGTIVTSSKPVAVVSGMGASRMNSECCNHMTEMVLPYEQQGTTYIIPNQYHSTCNYNIYTYTANHVNYDIVNVNGFNFSVLPGEIMQGDLTTSDDVDTVIAFRGVLVQLFCNTINETHKSYDSKMVTVPSVEQYKPDYLFEVVSDFPDDQPPDHYYITIIIPRDDQGGLSLDGHEISGGVKTMLNFNGKHWLVLTYPIQSGVHRITHIKGVPFGLIVMGRTQYEGYSYPGGFKFT